MNLNKKETSFTLASMLAMMTTFPTNRLTKINRGRVIEPEHKSKWKPAKAEMSPAQWQRQQRAIHNRAKSRLKYLTGKIYECPVCQTELQKLDWCCECRRWSVKRSD
jgi:hypothetical protein